MAKGENLEARMRGVRAAARAAGEEPVASTLQGVSRTRIEAVLAAVDLNTPDIRDVVFALLDPRPSFFARAARAGLRVCDGATTAQLGCHVGILQRGGEHKLDREGRDYWIKPMRELGAIEAVHLDKDTVRIEPGHLTAKAQTNMYRLNADFVLVLTADEEEWKARLNAWLVADPRRQMRTVQAEAAVAATGGHAELIAACRGVYAPRFLRGFEVVYSDSGDGERITDADRERLKAAGLEIELKDAMPDVLLWNPTTDELWVIEAVTSDGEVDLHKVDQLRALAATYGKAGVGFTTAYRTWKYAARRQGQHKNIAPDTYVWIAEDGGKHWRAETFPASAGGDD